MNVLKGKKVLFWGDSITEGACASAPEKRYVNVFAELSGAETFNYGICGTRLAKQRSVSQNPRFDKYFASRVGEMEENADYVVVFGGTNDFGHGDAPMGKIGDKTPDTFCGAVWDLFEKLYNKYPEAKIVALTPLHRESENSAINEIGIPTQGALSVYVNNMKAVLRLLSVPVLDLFGESNLQPCIPVLKEKYFVADGLHPNDAGHKRLAETIYSFLRRL